MDSIIEHVYPNPAAGSALPVERSELRAAKGMARKGLVTLAVDDGKVEMTFTKLGAEVYNIQLQAQAARSEKPHDRDQQQSVQP
uniref:hypothetical protein n=1 Tax=Burkholderia sp. M701 TaxID=326454 RepID=UPI0012EBD2F2|nr:hypothetical protein [Burkholderia sp. M701]